MNNKFNTYKFVNKFLKTNADAIQKSATELHKKYIGRRKSRSEAIEKYQKYHRKIVYELANNLEQKNLRAGLSTFKDLADIIAMESLKDGLHMEEAVDGIIFLKQALWKSLKEAGIMDDLPKEDFYKMNQIIGTYIDIVSSKIAFTYHQTYLKKQKELERQKDDFMGIVSHELKTPVTSLKAYGQVLFVF